MIARVPLDRPGEAEEVAAAATYFFSGESRFTTGTELRIDSGLTLLRAFLQTANSTERNKGNYILDKSSQFSYS